MPPRVVYGETRTLSIQEAQAYLRHVVHMAQNHLRQRWIGEPDGASQGRLHSRRIDKVGPHLSARAIDRGEADRYDAHPPPSVILLGRHLVQMLGDPVDGVSPT